ncbi:MAG TPA: hypothetical protein DDW76_30445 [Cyanobacteria bacterium UBA11369]|nr:hypothetical protein [Cyanobacteria bacterium UBA11369]
MIDRIILLGSLFGNCDGAIYYQFECLVTVKAGIVLKSVRHSQNSLSKIDRIQPFPKVEDVTSILLTVLR